MGELKDGERSWDHVLKPGVGFYTFKAIREYLRIHNRKMHRYCQDLGIELPQFVREEKNVRKTYKKGFRWLTQDEARRLIEHHHASRG